MFYFDRVATLLIERAMDHLDYVVTDITTKQGHPYTGCQIAGSGKVRSFFDLTVRAIINGIG